MEVTPAGSEGTVFDIATVADHEDECSNADCTGSPSETHHHLSYIAGCDVAGMAADYGEVEFCSLECAREFAELGAVRSTDPREELTIYTGHPVAVHIDVDGPGAPDTVVLGFDGADARDRADDLLESEEFDDVVDLEDITMRFEKL